MINVIKRDGRIEPFQFDKLHKMVFTACEGLEVSPALIETNSNLQIHDKISTRKIQDVLVRSAASLISVEEPDYQYAAARLLLFGLVKELFNNNYPHLKELIEKNVQLGLYDKSILEAYSEKELNQLNCFIDHKRDLTFTYAGLSQMIDKYLVQDRSTGKVYETPQYAYMLIAATLFKNYPKKTRISYVKAFYDAISQFYISLPTPIIAGVRTPKKGFASCCLIEVDDSLASIGAADVATLEYTAHRSGIGLDLSRIRGIKSKIRGGEVSHTGVIPFIKKFVATTLSCTQNGVRGGASTIYFPIWHKEIESILVLKNNKGTDDNRERRADYGIKISKLFYDRFLKDEEITLFSPQDVPLLNETFGLPEFDEHYINYEKDFFLPKTKVKARDLFIKLMIERAETGRIYVMNIDHANSHSSFKEPIRMSNLCTEITLPTKPMNHVDDSDARIALCILAAINLAKFEDTKTGRKNLRKYCDLVVRALEEIIELQQYPINAAKNSTINGRYLGIGVTNLAYFLAKNGLSYSDEALPICHRMFESIQYYLLEASNNLAKELGKSNWFHETKYSDGVLPIDTYKKDVDDICNEPYLHDWEELRKSIQQYGLRHGALTAQMPCESSSLVGNMTNGVDKVRSLLTIKQSRANSLPILAPEVSELANKYDMLWEQESNKGLINILAVMQKFFDQAISTNLSYNPAKYPNSEVPMSLLVQELLYAYKMGLKTLYYHYTNKTVDVTTENNSSNNNLEENSNQKDNDLDNTCSSGACSI